jgi:hypothetical protein
MAYRDANGNIVGIGDLLGTPQQDAPTFTSGSGNNVPAMDEHDGDEGDAADDGPWCLHITRTVNGYVAQGSDGNTFCFEDDEDCPMDDDPYAVARLLWHVISYFGAEGSRYDAARVRVTVEPGDKHSDGGEVAH